MTDTFPKYAKTEDPDVLCVYAELHRLRKDFAQKVDTLSIQYAGKTGSILSYGNLLEGYSVAGVRLADVENPKALPGKWKKPNGGVIKPYKSNEAYKDFNISYKTPEIPGRGTLIWGVDRVGSGVFFVHEGVAYSALGFNLRPMNATEAEECAKHDWTEVLASEYYLVAEAFEAAHKHKVG